LGSFGRRQCGLSVFRRGLSDIDITADQVKPITVEEIFLAVSSRKPSTAAEAAARLKNPRRISD
jgi:hypothetical protein